MANYFDKQIAEAQAHLRECWRVKSLRASLFPEWHELQLEERYLSTKLKRVREQKRAIELRWNNRRTSTATTGGK